MHSEYGCHSCMRQYHWHQHTSKHIILPQWGNSKTLCGRFWVELTNAGLKAQTAKVQAESGGRDFTLVIQQAKVPNVAKKNSNTHTESNAKGLDLQSNQNSINWCNPCITRRVNALTLLPWSPSYRAQTASVSCAFWFLMRFLCSNAFWLADKILESPLKYKYYMHNYSTTNNGLWGLNITNFIACSLYCWTDDLEFTSISLWTCKTGNYT